MGIGGRFREKDTNGNGTGREQQNFGMGKNKGEGLNTKGRVRGGDDSFCGRGKKGGGFLTTGLGKGLSRRLRGTEQRTGGEDYEGGS